MSREIHSWYDPEREREVSPRHVAMLAAASLGFTWRGEHAGDDRYPAATMFLYVEDVPGVPDEESLHAWIAYSPGRRYEVEAWIEGSFSKRARMTLSTLNELSGLPRGRHNLFQRIVDRLL